jgi:hypothetical protein
MKKINSLLLLLFLYSCAGTPTMTPSQILQSQQREEEIINKEFKGRKLDFIEGIWKSTVKPGGLASDIVRTEAIYKRGDVYIRAVLGFEEQEGVTQLKKQAENNFKGFCNIGYGFDTIKGTGVMYSTDDNTLYMECIRSGYIAETDKSMNSIARALGCFMCFDMPKEFNQKTTYTRLWPEDFSKHNAKFK